MTFDILATRDSDALPFKAPSGDFILKQYIETSIADTEFTLDIVLDEAADLSNSFIILMGVQPAINDGATDRIRVSFLDANTARFQREESNGITHFKALVLQAPSAVSVNFYTANMSTSQTSVNVTITAVDSAINRVQIYETESDGNNSTSTDKITKARASLASDTIVLLERFNGTLNPAVNIFVVELPPL